MSAKLCTECKWADDKGSGCKHRDVIATHAHGLAYGHPKSRFEERLELWPTGVCGKRGAKWEPKDG